MVITGTVGWSVSGVVLLAIALSGLVGHHPVYSSAGVLGAGGLVVSYRCFRAGAYEDEQYLLVRNPFRTYELKWESIRDFQLLSGMTTTWAFMEGGARVRIWAMACYPIGRLGRESLESMLSDLRIVAADHRASLGGGRR